MIHKQSQIRPLPKFIKEPQCDRCGKKTKHLLLMASGQICAACAIKLASTLDR